MTDYIYTRQFALVERAGSGRDLVIMGRQLSQPSTLATHTHPLDDCMV